MSEKLYELVNQGKYTAQDRPQDDEFKNFDRGDLIALIEAQEERIGELLADRPQGAWFKDDEGTFICSACGSGYKDQPTIMGKPMFKWCPICGARMKGTDDEVR